MWPTSSATWRSFRGRLYLLLRRLRELFVGDGLRRLGGGAFDHPAHALDRVVDRHAAWWCDRAVGDAACGGGRVGGLKEGEPNAVGVGVGQILETSDDVPQIVGVNDAQTEDREETWPRLLYPGSDIADRRRPALHVRQL